MSSHSWANMFGGRSDVIYYCSRGSEAGPDIEVGWDGKTGARPRQQRGRRSGRGQTRVTAVQVTSTVFPTSPQVSAQFRTALWTGGWERLETLFELTHQDTELNQGARSTSPCSFEG